MGHTAGGPGGLLLPGHPPEVLLGDGQQSLQLAYPLVGNIAGLLPGAGPFQQPDGFLMVGLGYVQGVFEGGFVLKSRFVVHATSVVPIPD